MNNATHSAPPIKLLLVDTLGEHYNFGARMGCHQRGWDLLRIDSGEALVTSLRDNRYNAVVMAPSMRVDVDQAMLRKVMESQPGAVRVMMPGMVSSDAQLGRSQDLTHRIYRSNQSDAEIAVSLDHQIKLARLLYKPANKAFFRAAGKLPAAPGVYRELTTALNNSNTDASHIADIVSQDPALAAKILSLVNSAYFGLERQISNINHAVSLLGARMIRGLALSGHLADTYPQGETWSSFSFDRLNQRALLVARLAQKICKEKKMSAAMQDQAFMGGLLHDIGILCIAAQDPTNYQSVLAASASKQASVCMAEKKMLGFFHGEIGALLLTQWNLPPQVCEAVLLHHTPHLSVDNEFTALTAVHIADALIPALKTESGADLSTTLSLDYIKRLQLVADISRWKIDANLMARVATH